MKYDFSLLTEEKEQPEHTALEVKSLDQLDEMALQNTESGRSSKGHHGKKNEKKTEDRKKLGVGRVIGRISAIILAVLLLVVFALLNVIFVLERGPSPTATRLFVLSVKETSAAGFLADIFLSDEEVNAILEAQSESLKGSNDTTDSSLINIPKGDDDNKETDSPSAETTDSDDSADSIDSSEKVETPTTEKDNDGIEIIEIKKSTYNGIVMKISDPTRVFLGTPESYGESSVGLTLRDMIARYGAVGGINGGGFYDPNGSGTGGIPDGLVISEGELLWGNPGSTYNVIGFDGDGILHVGNMTASRALDIGVKYACSFGPTLIINGTPCNKGGSLGGGMNPRTAIGQCADGSVLMVVINGRSLGSLGATYDDLIDLFFELGAVNAANLDGGSSSLLMYNGEFLNTSASVIGERELPTTFLVK